RCARRTRVRTRSARGRQSVRRFVAIRLSLSAVGLVAAGAAVVAPACKGTSAPSGPAPADLGDPRGFVAAIPSAPPCAMACAAECAEASAPWVCPALAEWSAIPHEEACAWDGATMPAPVKGACAASEPSGDATTPVTRAGKIVLPDGRRLAPAGAE